MAQGDLTVFNEFAEAMADGRLDLDTDTFKIAIVDTLPSASDTIPTWGAGGTTNISANEVTAGGGYTTGGETLANVSWGQTSGTATFDADDVSWTSSGSGDPADCVAAVVYDDTAANKDCVCFIDLTTDGGTTPVSLLEGDIEITFNASGIFTNAIQ